ncbi:MAG: MGMT family protein, partial [Desulfamplus sp.]|nr:MGMT family protein [Desulfamplus sp.]
KFSCLPQWDNIAGNWINYFRQNMVIIKMHTAVMQTFKCDGRSKGCRAVGGAVGKNPIPVIIPCHRVIGADGSLTGFSGGLDIKRYLLNLEGGRYF